MLSSTAASLRPVLVHSPGRIRPSGGGGCGGGRPRRRSSLHYAGTFDWLPATLLDVAHPPLRPLEPLVVWTAAVDGDGHKRTETPEPPT